MPRGENGADPARMTPLQGDKDWIMGRTMLARLV